MTVSRTIKETREQKNLVIMAHNMGEKVWRGCGNNVVMICIRIFSEVKK